MSKKQHEPEHIIVQLRKVINTHGHSKVRFSKETVSIGIDEAQNALNIYSDAAPNDKELIQAHICQSPQHLQQVAEGSWYPEHEIVRVKEKTLFNTDPIFGLDEEPARKFRRRIKRR